jgi:hypothetical protein
VHCILISKEEEYIHMHGELCTTTQQDSKCNKPKLASHFMNVHPLQKSVLSFLIK